jgi:Flp pilus assembly protein TadB
MTQTRNGESQMNTLKKILISLGIGVAAISLIANAIELIIISFIILAISFLSWAWVEGDNELRKKEKNESI